jgi:hypothetical protein
VVVVVLAHLAGDASFGKRPLVLLWAVLLALGPLPLDALARIRGRSVTTTRRQLRELARYDLAAPDAEGHWYCPLDPEQIGLPDPSLFPSRHDQRPFARMAADAGTAGRAARLRSTTDAARVAFHNHGVDARAEKARMVAHIQAKRAHGASRDNRPETDPRGSAHAA